MTSEPKLRPRLPIVVAPAGTTAVVPGDVMKVPLAEAHFGLSRKAIEGKIARGDWLEGRQYHRDPCGDIWIDRKGVQLWVLSGGKLAHARPGPQETQR